MSKATRWALVLGATLLLAACGRAGSTSVAVSSGPEPAAADAQGNGKTAAMCVAGATECDDMVVGDGAGLDDECSVSSNGEVSCPGSGGAVGGGTSPGSPGTGAVLCDGTQPAAGAPAGTDCSAPAEPVGREVRPAPDGLSGIHPVGWDRYTAKGRRLTLHWYSGVAPCSVLHSVAVTERARQVVVTLREGTSDPDAACIEIAEAVQTTVRLSRPLGDRRVVDGAER